ncbi:Cytochrome P450 [Metarhizium album ARSEF 1941]|uniref:Cytochrome P450 n=1 Tax=Metarhizium album (strain ARSEF 1941) TaxID=1081103 RepID=A0A0B2WSY9_METAS|nr:Cytochrome P450 [Metarhizium album ARSEF 1941]KHN96075.1 Cytochrome P450 [Metarhizium album ARSEF 1941]
MSSALPWFLKTSLNRENGTGLVLGYTFWYLAQHRHAQLRIRAELEAAGIDMTKRPAPETDVSISPDSIPVALEKVKYLDAVICESLRMRPTSTLLPRITPSDRRISLAGVDNIPPDTRVNAFQWFVHRDPEKWEKVDEWVPERWLGRDGLGRKNDREDVLWAFASGPRICLGNNWTFYGEVLSLYHFGL